MKQLLTGLIAFALSGSLVAQKVINDPDAEARNVTGFHILKVSNAFDVYLTQGTEDAVAISASKTEYKENIKTLVENGTLKVSFEGEKKFWKALNGDRMKLRVYVSYKSLDKLDISGACNVHFLSPLKGDELTIELSGASDIRGGEINVNKLKVDLSGASDIRELKGKATYLNVEASGASDFKAMDLVTDYCDVRASGASSVHITVNKELTANASGASDIKYKGDGLIREIKTGGASSVSRKS